VVLHAGNGSVLPLFCFVIKILLNFIKIRDIIFSPRAIFVFHIFEILHVIRFGSGKTKFAVSKLETTLIKAKTVGDHNCYSSS